jgi:hypothetical protein
MGRRMDNSLLFPSSWKTAGASVALLLAFLIPTQGAVSVNYFTDPAQEAYAISSTDLINSGSPSLLSMTDTGYAPFSFDGGTSTTAALNDGSAGIAYASGNGALSTGTFDLDGTWTSTFFLNGGYTISQIDTIASWPAQRASQAYNLSVRYVGNLTFTPVTTINFYVASDQSSKIVITDGSGPLAVNVDAIQFDFVTPTGGGSPESVYREIDVTGALTIIPEPSSLGLVALGGVALMLGRLRKR